MEYSRRFMIGLPDKERLLKLYNYMLELFSRDYSLDKYIDFMIAMYIKRYNTGRYVGYHDFKIKGRMIGFYDSDEWPIIYGKYWDCSSSLLEIWARHDRKSRLLENSIILEEDDLFENVVAYKPIYNKGIVFGACEDVIPIRSSTDFKMELPERLKEHIVALFAGVYIGDWYEYPGMPEYVGR